MGLPDLITALRRQAVAAMNRELFDVAKERHPVLVGHESVLAVLEALGVPSRRSVAEKDALIRALIAEQQLQPHPLWATALLVAFQPMLRRLRGRLVCRALAGQDLDQLVVAAFLEAVATFPLDRRGAPALLCVRQLTARWVFRRLTLEQREHALVCTLEHAELLELEQRRYDEQGERRWPELMAQEVAPPDPEESAQLEAFLIGLLGDRLEPGCLRLVIATLVHGERLRSLVSRTCPALTPTEQDREQARLKRRHSRTIATMRELLAGSRGLDEAAALH